MSSTAGIVGAAEPPPLCAEKDPSDPLPPFLDPAPVLPPEVTEVVGYSDSDTLRVCLNCHCKRLSIYPLFAAMKNLNIQGREIQGDTSGRTKPIVDMTIKVVF